MKLNFLDRWNLRIREMNNDILMWAVERQQKKEEGAKVSIWPKLLLILFIIGFFIFVRWLIWG